MRYASQNVREDRTSARSRASWSVWVSDSGVRATIGNRRGSSSLAAQLAEPSQASWSQAEQKLSKLGDALSTTLR